MADPHPHAPPTDDARVAALVRELAAARADAAASRAHAAFALALADALRPLGDPAEVQDVAARVLGQHLGAGRVYYAEVSADGLAARVPDGYRDGMANMAGTYRFEPYGDAGERAVHGGETYVLADTHADPRLDARARAGYDALGVRAQVIAPLVKDRRLAAMLVVHTPAPRAWTPAEVALIEETAERTWAAVQHACADAEREASVRRLLLLTDAVPALISYIDTEQRYRFANRGYAEWFGRPVESILGRTVREVIGEVAYVAAQADIEAALRGEPATYERLLPYRDGGARTVRSSLIPDRAPDGSVVGYFALIVDISADRAREAAVRESEARYRTLFSSIDEGFALCEILVDGDGAPVDYRFLDVNPRFEAMTGLGDAVGRTARELVPGVEAHWAETYGRVALGGERLRFEQSSDAMGRWFDVFATPVEPRGRFALVFADVTERRRAEDALRESEARYRTLFESVDEGFFLCEVVRDAAGRAVDYRFIEVNPAFGALTGLSPAAMTGKTVREAIPGVESLWIERVGHVADTGEPTRYEDYAAPLERWIAAHAYPQGNDRVAVLFDDVTARKRAEQILREANETLEARVAERTAAVRTLSAALTRAEQAERERLSRVLHDDLQQTLYGLQLRAHALAAGTPAAAQPAAATLLDHIQSAIRTTRSLAVELAPPVLQGEGLAQALRWLAVHAGQEHGLAVEVTVEPAAERVPLAEEARVLLFQVARELLFNASKHAATDRARLALALVGGPPGDAPGVLSLEVADDGQGFDPDLLTRRADGLGLPSVRDRLAYAGGRLDVASAPGRGTRVRAFLPADTFAADPFAADSSAEANPPAQPDV